MVELSKSSINERKDEILNRYRTRLENLAREVVRKQIASLNQAGTSEACDIDFNELEQKGVLMGQEDGIEKDLYLPSPLGSMQQSTSGRSFGLEVFEVDKERKEVHVRLFTTELEPSGSIPPKVTDDDFWVGYFDFPLIDNTRLSNNNRCAVVIDSWYEDYVQLVIVYFPGSRASLKEKPFYDEVLHDLSLTGKLINSS
ncbi:MAG: hypothetical protein GY941_03770 [Planctomycetes bacterium]|nr:hypothetical protein [Planctomycetota bacterium]